MKYPAAAMTYTAVITGGNKGIGADLADAMLAKGWQVISLARHPGEASGVEHVICDLSDNQAVAAAAADIAARHEVTHFVQNAGIILPNLIEDARPEDMLALTQLHLASALVLVQAFLPAMKARGFGRVLFNASRAALGAKTRTAYAASKAGMIGMARTWALETAADGITVNVVAPGPIADTEMFRSVIPAESEREKALAAQIPVKRLGRSDDVARVVLFFCDADNSFITGQTLYVCGGASVGTLTI